MLSYNHREGINPEGRKVERMKYFKELTTGRVVKADTMPEGKWWREATEREYLVHRERVARAVKNLEKAVAYKARLLGV